MGEYLLQRWWLLFYERSWCYAHIH